MRSERRRRLAGVAAIAAALVVALPPALPADGSAAEAALGRVYEGAAVEKDTVFLTEEQAERAAELAGTALPSRIVTRYVARAADGDLLGHGYVDTHLVRTKPETLLIVVDPDATVRRIEVLTFEEPRDYLPSERWYAQFEGRALDDDLGLRRGIRTLSGATLSSRSTTDAVRRALALHEVAAP